MADWKLVDSSWIHAINYFAPEEALEINLLNGKQYVFFGVPEKIYLEFLESDSKGRFFNDHIKGKFNSQNTSGMYQRRS